MASFALMAASLAIAGLQTRNANRQAKKQQAAVEVQTDREVKELKRQQVRDNTVSQEERSDRAIEADRQMAALIAAGADGGITSAALARSIVAVGAQEGRDIGRIEGNRLENARARRSVAVSTIEETGARKSQTSRRIKGNNLKFLGTAIDTTSKAVNQAAMLVAGP